MKEFAGFGVGTITRDVGVGWSLVARQGVHGVALLLKGGSLGCGGEPFGPMNWAYVCGPQGVTEAVRRFKGVLEERGLPGVMTIAGTVRAAGDEAAAAAGMEREEKPSPLMAADLSAYSIEAGRFVVKRVDDLAGLRDACVVLRDAYDLPLEHMLNMVGPDVPESSAVSWYLAYDDGQPASACAVALVGSTVGVYSVGTAQAHRRKGAARAAVGVALTRSAAQGARVAGLRSDNDAIPLYEGLGFRTIDTPSEWYLPCVKAG